MSLAFIIRIYHDSCLNVKFVKTLLKQIKKKLDNFKFTYHHKRLRDTVLIDRLTKLSSEVHLHLPNA